jgi:hypothetical protein
VNESPGERPGQPLRFPVVSWERDAAGNAEGAIAVLGLSSPKVKELPSEAFGRVRLALSGARGYSERCLFCWCRLTCPSTVRVLGRKQAPSRGGLTRPGAQPGGRAPESGGLRCGFGPAGPLSCAVAVAVAVVTARRAGTRRSKPRAARTRQIGTPAESGDRRERERSERPDEQDCRAGAQAQRTRLMRCGGGRWSR